MKRCYSCFKEYEDMYQVCPHCGTVEISEPKEVIQLPPGTVLANRYILGLAVGAGGFGIVYRAYDTKLESIVAVKEFFVNRLVTRAPGLKNLIISKKSQDEFDYRKERFLVEAKNMARFGSHRSMPNVFEYFEENNTAYIVMELLQGVALNDYLHESNEMVDIDFAIFITNEVGLALKTLHDSGIIHRDVAPDNIFVCSESNIRIKLMDFGAAKLADSSDDVIDIILKPGYSPTEQYDNSKNIGPWTDIYALGATLYVMLTGVKPEESTNRKIQDTLVPPNEINPNVSQNLSNAVMKAMALDRHMRFKNVTDFLNAINGKRKVFTLAEERKKRKRRQITGILAAVLVLGIGAFGVYERYQLMRAEEYLDPANISLWYEADVDSNESRAIQFMVNTFNQTYPDIKIDITRYDHTQYADAIAEAAANNALPNIFETTGISENELSAARDVSEILQTEQAASCLFLADQYSSYYSDFKKIPIGYEVPVAIVTTAGKNSINYSFDTFSSLDDFIGAKIAFDSAKTSILSKSFTISDVTEKEFDGDEGTCAVLITTSDRIQHFKQQKNIMSTEWHVAYCVGTVYGEFDYEWGLGNGNNDQRAAADKLLTWMLGNAYQNTLMISMAQDGQLPINMECLSDKISLSDDYQGLDTAKDYIIFK